MERKNLRGLQRLSCSSRKGFTLLEVLVAVAILSIVSTSLLMIRNNSVSQAAEAYNLRRAVMLAAHKMREIEMSEDIMSAQGAGDFPGHPGLEWHVEVMETSLDKGSGALSEVPVNEIRLTITYPSTDGEKEFQYVSIVPPVIELELEEMQEEETIPTDVTEELEKLGIPLPDGFGLP